MMALMLTPAVCLLVVLVALPEAMCTHDIGFARRPLRGGFAADQSVPSIGFARRPLRGGFAADQSVLGTDWSAASRWGVFACLPWPWARTPPPTAPADACSTSTVGFSPAEDEPAEDQPAGDQPAGGGPGWTEAGEDGAAPANAPETSAPPWRERACEADMWREAEGEEEGSGYDTITENEAVDKLKRLGFKDAVLPLLIRSARRRGLTDPEALLQTFRESKVNRHPPVFAGSSDQPPSAPGGPSAEHEGGGERGKDRGLGVQDQSRPCDEGGASVTVQQVGDGVHSVEPEVGAMDHCSPEGSVHYQEEDPEEESPMFASEFSGRGAAAASMDDDESENGERRLDGEGEGPVLPSERDMRIRRWVAEKKALSQPKNFQPVPAEPAVRLEPAVEAVPARDVDVDDARAPRSAAASVHQYSPLAGSRVAGQGFNGAKGEEMKECEAQLGRQSGFKNSLAMNLDDAGEKGGAGLGRGAHHVNAIQEGVDMKLVNCTRLNDVDGMRAAIAEGADLEYQGISEMYKAAGPPKKSKSWMPAPPPSQRMLNPTARLHGRASPLHHAASLGHVQAIHVLLKAGADVDSRNMYQCTPLHYACHWGHWQAAEILLEAGADITALNECQWTALHHAMFAHSPAAAELLLARGIPPDMMNDDLDRPWDIAMRKERLGHVEVLERYHSTGIDGVAREKLDVADQDAADAGFKYMDVGKTLIK